MTIVDIKSRNAKMVADIRSEVERMQRIRNAAPYMLSQLKVIARLALRDSDLVYNHARSAIAAAEGVDDEQTHG